MPYPTRNEMSRFRSIPTLINDSQDVGGTTGSNGFVLDEDATPSNDLTPLASVVPCEEQDYFDVVIRSGSPFHGTPFKATFRDGLPTFLSTTAITLPFDLLSQPLDYRQILSCPNLYRLIICQPSSEKPIESTHDRDARVSSFTQLLQHKSFNSLRSVVMPIYFGSNPQMLYALKQHRNLMQLEISIPPSFPVEEGGFEATIIALGLGLLELQQLRVIIIPHTLANPDIVNVLSKMENLEYLMIKNTGPSWTGGDQFVDMISRFDISSAHCFHALKKLDIDIERTHPENRTILYKRFPNIAYL